MAETYLLWGRRPGSRRADLLWPVEIHAVQVPAYGAAINLFQEVLLRLLQTGIKALDELAKLSSLDRQLVAFILAKELQPNRWIDHRFDLTEDGVAILEGRAASAGAERVMFAFWDQVAGRWMPFLSERPPEIFPLNDATQRPRFLVDRDSGHQASPYLLHRPRAERTVQREALAPALKQFERERARYDDEDEVVSGNYAALQFLDEVPQVGRVWVQAFVAEGDLHPWLVTDPFRPDRPNRSMREALAALLEDDPRLQDWLGQRLALPSKAVDSHDDEVGAVLRLEAHLSELVPPSEDPAVELIREYTARVLRLIHRLRNSAVALPEDLSSAVVHSGSCLEALLQWMLLRWPAEPAGWPDRWDRRELRAWLAALPMVDSLSGTCIRALESQSSDMVLQAASERNQPMKALLVAALLSTHIHESHPLKRAPMNSLDWTLVGLRNKGGHATRTRLQRDPVLRFAEMALRWVELFKNHY
jgi:hypothetical protein